MAKKSVEEKESSKKKTISKEKNVEKMLVENFVSLQRVMTNLSARFDELTLKISQLLELFESSAKALAKKEINITKPVDERKILEQLDTILNQNKIIARGLTLVHERIGGGGEEPKSPQMPPSPLEFKPRGQTTGPPFFTPEKTQSKKAPIPLEEDYQKSPFSKDFE